MSPSSPGQGKIVRCDQLPQSYYHQQSSVQVDPAFVAASVAVHQVFGTSGHGGSGTVVWVEDSAAYVLTCRHVVGRAAGKISVTFASGVELPATFVAADSKADLSLLRVAGDDATPWVPVGATDPAMKSNVSQVGFPGWAKGKQNTRRGTILGYNEVVIPDWGPHKIWQQYANFQSDKGDSGSGIFDEKEKTLVGVIWAGPRATAVCCQDIRRFLGNCLPACLRPKRPQMPRTPDTKPPITIPPVDDGKLDRIIAAFAELQKEIRELKLKPGPPGKDGLDGRDGKDGKSIVGPAGPPGAPGKDGRDGKDGTSASHEKEILSLREEIRVLRDTLNNMKGTIRVRIDPNKK